MLIVLEGLPGAGKTSLLEALTSRLRAIGIPESVLTNEAVQSTIVIPNRNSEHIYMLNEELKSRIAIHFRDQLVIMDRNYASTLALNYAKYKIDSDTDYVRVLDWYYAGRGDTLAIPDLYVYLTIPVAQCNKRKNRQPSPFDIWTRPEYLEASKDYYDVFFQVLEPAVRRIVIDANVDPQCLVERIAHEVQGTM